MGAPYYGYMTCGNGIEIFLEIKMRKSIYVITGVLALSVAGFAISQERGPGRGMSQMDTDGNGTVEKAEFKAMFEKRYAETDTNNDGITLEEYQVKAEADRAAWQERRAERRAEREAKKAEKEANKEERSAEREAKMAERLQERFNRLDEDNDGKVTAEEYASAGNKMFERMDRNDDGILNDRRDRGERGRRGGRGSR